MTMTMLQRFRDAYTHPLVDWDKYYRIYGNWLTSEHARDGLITWQIEDWKFIDAQQECCILRSRKASKTHDLMDWLIQHVAITGEKWAWLSCQMGQLNEALLAASKHPWYKGLKWVLKKQYIELINGTCFVFGHISLGMLGLGLHGMIIDEEQSMEENQALNVYPQMRPMMAITNGKIIHTGTRWIDTIFDYNCSHYPLSTHDWTQCPWLFYDDSFIDREIRSHIRPEWEIDLLYRCIPTLPGGSVFPNVVELVGAPPECHPISQGVDFNALPGHILIRLGWCAQGLFALKEECFLYKTDDDRLQRRCNEFPTEIESGGWNDIYAPNMMGVAKAPFTEGSKTEVDHNGKPERIRLLLQQPLLINRLLTPHLWNDVHRARYDDNGKVDTGDLHYLAAAMHAVTAPLRVFVPNQNSSQNYGTNLDEVRLRAKLLARR